MISSALCCFSQTRRPPLEDIQFWHETSVTVPIVTTTDSKGKKSDKLSMFFNGVLRWGDNIKRTTDERIGFGLDYKVNRYLGLTASYLYAAAQPVPGRREHESRLRFMATLEKKFGKFVLRDRNMVEYRIRTPQVNSTRYRNRIQLSRPISRDGRDLFTPFATDEVFYDFHEHKWTRNEFSAGVSKKINNNLTTEFFYGLRNNTGSTLKYVHVFGANLRIRAD
jgi:hypothetical protein